MRQYFALSTIPKLLLGIAVIASAASAAQAQIKVTSAVPDNAAQGTINLSVVVKGSGFKKGAQAQWFVSGTTNPGGVTVNSTTFNSSGQLTANITVAIDAVISGFDIVVKNADGRTGKGTELFAIKSKTTAVCPTPLPIDPLLNACTSGSQFTGCLDSTFGAGGFVSTNVDNSATPNQSIMSVLQQADGKLIAVGNEINGVEAVVARYNLDGTLDNTFGSGGIATYSFAGMSGTVHNGLLDSAGNVVLTGWEGSNAFVIRFTPAGRLDSSFGTGGVSLYPGEARALALQPDGKIVVVGRGGLVFRLNSNGSIDTAFGSGGAVTIPGVTFYDAVTVQNIAGTPYILAAGANTNGKLNYNLGIARLTLAGTLDPTFAVSGQATNSLCGSGGSAVTIALDPISGFYVAGYLPVNGANDLFLAKYTNSGQPDTSFGDLPNLGQGLSGATVLDYFGTGNSYPIGNGLALSKDAGGNTLILVGGTASNFFTLSRFTANGALDKSFAGTGAIAADFVNNPTDNSYGIAIQSDGRIVQAGFTTPLATPHNTIFGLVRLWP